MVGGGTDDFIRGTRNIWGMMDVFALDCADGFTGFVHVSELIKLYNVNMCILLSVNYISINIF